MARLSGSPSAVPVARSTAAVAMTSGGASIRATRKAPLRPLVENAVSMPDQAWRATVPSSRAMPTAAPPPTSWRKATAGFPAASSTQAMSPAETSTFAVRFRGGPASVPSGFMSATSTSHLSAS